jgi:hypothetical protein
LIEEQFLEIIENFQQGIVIIDEAYNDFLMNLHLFLSYKKFKKISWFYKLFLRFGGLSFGVWEWRL